jgi:glycerol-3-phosphate dehydrogenase
MKRDVESLRKEKFDLLVVGGGVYGAWTACHAAFGNIKTALIDRGDWASGTSSASSKLIHGGLRYLEQFRLGLVKSSLHERRLLARLAPHRVTPLRFVLPIYRGDRVGSAKMRAGLWLYDFISGDGQPVDSHHHLSPEEAVSRCPQLSGDGLTGAFNYGDCVTDDARFTLELVSTARSQGVATANYVEAEALRLKADRVAGVAAIDRTTSEQFEIRARVVVNAAGPWVTTAMDGAAAPGPVRLVKGVHLVMPPLQTEDALLFFSRRDKRVLFVIPWYGRTLLGTTDTEITGDASAACVEPEDIEYLLGEANRVLPETRWDKSAIIRGFAGVRALADNGDGAPESVSREWVLESPRPGLLVSVGGKFTTARPDAARIVRRVLESLGMPRDGSADSRARYFPWFPADKTRDQWISTAVRLGNESGLEREVAVSVANRYGLGSRDVFKLAAESPELSERIMTGLPFIKAEIVYSAATEMVVCLEDLLRRRIPLLLLSRLEDDQLEELAQIAAGPLGWTAERVDREVSALAQKYPAGH